MEEKVKEIIEPKVTELGYELYDVQYLKEGKDNVLRVFIDKPEGINIDDCVKVSRELNEIIDGLDFLEDSFNFEVSSSGEEKEKKNKLGGK